MHSIFTTNPHLLDFCRNTNIFDQVNSLLETGTNEGFDKAIKLIQVSKVPQTVIIGNGDVADYEDGISKAKESGVNGIMIGRGIFKNPWVFLPKANQIQLDTRENRINLLLQHLETWKATWVDDGYKQKNFASMKKFVKMYISNFAGALDLRVQFMNLNTCSEMVKLCRSELDKNGFNANNIITHS